MEDNNGSIALRKKGKLESLFRLHPTSTTSTIHLLSCQLSSLLAKLLTLTEWEENFSITLNLTLTLERQKTDPKFKISDSDNPVDHQCTMAEPMVTNDGRA